MRALGIGLAVEALNSPHDMREDLFRGLHRDVFARLSGPAHTATKSNAG
jgi:hypothetical protein